MNTDILFEKRWVIPAVAGVAAFAAGTVAGHIWQSRKESEEGEVIVINMDELRQELDEDIARVEEDETFVDDGATPEYEGSPLDLAVSEEVEEVPEPEVIEHKPEPKEEPLVNIFANGKVDDWNWEEQLLARKNARGPYPIHEEEFMTDEDDSFPQSTLTWYEGDEIMADSDDKPMYNWRSIVGPLRFGYGSSDDNSFYVRHPGTKQEYEILRDPGDFAQIVLGLEADAAQERAELKHSRQMRFRPDDY